MNAVRLGSYSRRSTVAGHIEFRALEIDDAIALLVTAALPAHRHAAGVIAAAMAVLAFGQRLDGVALVKLRAVDQHQLALARRRRLVLFERHRSEPRRDVDLVTLFEGHDRFFEIAAF